MCIQTGVELAAECTRRVSPTFAGVLSHHFTLRRKAQAWQTAFDAQGSQGFEQVQCLVLAALVLGDPGQREVGAEQGVRQALTFQHVQAQHQQRGRLGVIATFPASLRQHGCQHAGHQIALVHALFSARQRGPEGLLGQCTATFPNVAQARAVIGKAVRHGRIGLGSVECGNAIPMQTALIGVATVEGVKALPHPVDRHVFRQRRVRRFGPVPKQAGHFIDAIRKRCDGDVNQLGFELGGAREIGLLLDHRDQRFGLGVAFTHGQRPGNGGPKARVAVQIFRGQSVTPLQNGTNPALHHQAPDAAFRQFKGQVGVVCQQCLLRCDLVQVVFGQPGAGSACQQLSLGERQLHESFMQHLSGHRVQSHPVTAFGLLQNGCLLLQPLQVFAHVFTAQCGGAQVRVNHVELRQADQQLGGIRRLLVNQDVDEVTPNVRRGSRKEAGHVVGSPQRRHGQLHPQRPAFGEFVQAQGCFQVVVASQRGGDQGQGFVLAEPQVRGQHPRVGGAAELAAGHQGAGWPRAQGDAQVGRGVAQQIGDDLGPGADRCQVHLVEHQQDLHRHSGHFGEPACQGFARVDAALQPFDERGIETALAGGLLRRMGQTTDQPQGFVAGIDGEPERECPAGQGFTPPLRQLRGLAKAGRGQRNDDLRACDIQTLKAQSRALNQVSRHPWRGGLEHQGGIA